MSIGNKLLTVLGAAIAIFALWSMFFDHSFDDGCRRICDGREAWVKYEYYSNSCFCRRPLGTWEIQRL